MMDELRTRPVPPEDEAAYEDDPDVPPGHTYPRMETPGQHLPDCFYPHGRKLRTLEHTRLEHTRPWTTLPDPGGSLSSFSWLLIGRKSLGQGHFSNFLLCFQGISSLLFILL